MNADNVQLVVARTIQEVGSVTLNEVFTSLQISGVLASPT
jgi:hypothetical protein